VVVIADSIIQINKWLANSLITTLKIVNVLTFFTSQTQEEHYQFVTAHNQPENTTMIG